MRLLLASVVLLLACWFSGPALAAGEADTLIDQGLELRRQGKNADALQVFLKAHAIEPSARALAQIGLAEIDLGRWMDAELRLNQALRRHDPWIENAKNHEVVEKAFSFARQHLARIRLYGTDGAQVSIGGSVIGTLPIPSIVRVTAGKIQITATASGHRRFDKELSISGAEETRVDIILEPLGENRVAPPALVYPAAASSPVWAKWVAGALFAGSAAAFAAGTVWLVVEGRGTCNAPPGGICERVYTTSGQGWAAIVTGAALAAGGTGLLLWADRQRTVGVAFAPAAVGITGRF
jgi:hypothetical protein